MSVIVNSAWKSKKAEETVTYKGEEYTIGYDAFASLEDAVKAGQTAELVVIDKKLTSPVKDVAIESAATDIFEAEVNESESKDGKTVTTVTKFSASASGTASVKDEDIALNGFDSVTAKDAGGLFLGGKQNYSETVKETEDGDKYIYDENTTYSSSASGSLSVTGKDVENKAEVITGAIPAENDDEVFTGDASFANVTLKNAVVETVNGGTTTGKYVEKFSDEDGEKISLSWTSSDSKKIGSGTANLTDTDVTSSLRGFKTVNVTASKADVTVGDIKSGSSTIDESVKSSFVEDKNSSVSVSRKEKKSAAGTVNLTGKNEVKVTLEGKIDNASSISMKYAEISEGEEEKTISSNNSTTSISKSISVKKQKEDAALTASLSKDQNSTAAGSFTADSSVINGSVNGMKTVSIQNSTINNAQFESSNVKTKTTKKETGTAVAGVVYDDGFGEYVENFTEENVLDLVLEDKAYSKDYSYKKDRAVGGTSFKFGGKVAGEDDSNVTVMGYKSVSLNNTNKDVALTAVLNNDNAEIYYTTDSSSKVSFTPDTSYSTSYKMNESGKVVGDATISGNVNVGVNAFASVKVSGANLTGLDGAYNWNDSESSSRTIKKGKENPIGDYSWSRSSSDKGVTSLEVSKSELNGEYFDLKSAKLQNVSGAAGFSGSIDSTSKGSKKVTWNAEEIGGEEYAPVDITDESVTSWSDSSDYQSSATGSFTLTNSSNDEIELTGLHDFKSVKIAGGSVEKTTVGDMTGSDTVKTTGSRNLSVKGAKGSFSKSSSTNAQAATTLEVGKATIEGASQVKTVKATNVAGNADFTASLNSDTKSNVKVEWNAEKADFADILDDDAKPDPTNEYVTSYSSDSTQKSSVVGTLTLSNSDVAVESVSAKNFKSADLTFTGEVEGDFTNVGDSSSKSSYKKSASETKRTQTITSSSALSATASLEITGKKNAPAGVLLNYGEEEGMNYSKIALNDAYLSDDGALINAYSKSVSVSGSENATLSNGDVTAVTYKLTSSYSMTGNGSFSAASTGGPLTAFDGTLRGFKTVSLEDKVSIGNVNNFKYVGYKDVDEVATVEVPFDAESFDITIDPPEEGMLEIRGNVSGSYTLSQNGDISSKWTGTSSRTTSGSFSQTASVSGIVAGYIQGYDKVTLDGVAFAEGVYGKNKKSSTVATYKFTKGDVAIDTVVTTSESTASSSASVKGQKFNNVMQVAEVFSVSGFKTVTLENASVESVSGGYRKSIGTEDRGSEVYEFEDEGIDNSVGSLTAKNSTIGSEVTGFQTVSLTDTVATDVTISGGNHHSVDLNWEVMTYGESVATGSFTATADQEKEEEFAVGTVAGFQKVSLTNYSAGEVTAGFLYYSPEVEEEEAEVKLTATYLKKTDGDEDKDIPATWKKEAKTKGNTFTATAVARKDKGFDEITVGDVLGYDKVEATNLVSVGNIENAAITDNYGNVYYGSWTASATGDELNYNAIKVTAGSSVTVAGQKNLQTAVTGNIAGYSEISLENVVLGSEDTDVLYSGFNFDYTTKTDNKDNFYETESMVSNGSLEISKAVAVDGTVISMIGFKSVTADIGSAVAFGDIIGGNETKSFVNDELTSSSNTVAGELDLTSKEGEVLGQVYGFQKMTFTDTNIGVDSLITGSESKFDGKETKVTGKSTITFCDNDKDGEGQTIAGTIRGAKEIVLKAAADEGTDFFFTGMVRSQNKGCDTLISVNKCEADMNLSNFYLDEGDKISLASGAIVRVDLGDSTVEDYFANMKDSSISGSGTLAFTGSAYGDQNSFIEALKKDSGVKVSVSNITYNTLA